MRLWLTTSLLTSCFMTGLIWFVQVVHYPMFANVGAEGFAEYERIHQQRTTWVVMPVMLVELFAAVALVWVARDADRLWSGVALGLLIVIWLSTALWQVPLHTKLLAGFEAGSGRALVLSNWVRTVAWTARTGLLMWLLFRSLSPIAAPQTS